MNGFHDHWMTHRHRGLRSFSPRTPPADFIFASSSSMMSWGLMVIWIICGVMPFVKPESFGTVSKDMRDYSRSDAAYQIGELYR